MQKPSQRTQSTVTIIMTLAAIVAALSIVTTALTRSWSVSDGTQDEQAPSQQVKKAPAKGKDGDQTAKADAITPDIPEIPIAPVVTGPEMPTDVATDEQEGQADEQNEVLAPVNEGVVPPVEFVIADAAPDDPAIIVDDDMFRIVVTDRHIRQDGSSVGYATLLVTNKSDRVLGLRFIGDWTRHEGYYGNPLTDGPDVPSDIPSTLDPYEAWGYEPGQTREVWIITDTTVDDMPPVGSIDLEGTIETYEQAGTTDGQGTTGMYDFSGGGTNEPKRSYHVTL